VSETFRAHEGAQNFLRDIEQSSLVCFESETVGVCATPLPVALTYRTISEDQSKESSFASRNLIYRMTTSMTSIQLKASQDQVFSQYSAFPSFLFIYHPSLLGIA
jgi:hypothetical protein